MSLEVGIMRREMHNKSLQPLPSKKKAVFSFAARWGYKFEHASQMRAWLLENSIKLPNLAAPQKSKRPGMYAVTNQFLDQVSRALAC